MSRTMKYIDPTELGGTTPLTVDAFVADPGSAGLSVELALPNTFDVATLPDDLSAVRSIALQFPKWTDGRAYSQARLLRVRKRYAGEIRATGEVLADMMPLLARTGFDAVVLRADQKVEVAERALGFFAGHYQGDVLEPRPLFARNPA